MRDLPQRVTEGIPSEQFQNEMHAMLQPSCIFVGYVRPGDKRLYRGDGTAAGGTIEPGDVFDEIPEFLKACEAGAYQKVTA